MAALTDIGNIEAQAHAEICEALAGQATVAFDWSADGTNWTTFFGIPDDETSDRVQTSPVVAMTRAGVEVSSANTGFPVNGIAPDDYIRIPATTGHVLRVTRTTWDGQRALQEIDAETKDYR